MQAQIKRARRAAALFAWGTILLAGGVATNHWWSGPVTLLGILFWYISHQMEKEKVE